MSFWSELKRRKVFQVATVYAVTAWILVQVIVSIEAPLQLPAWTDTFVIVLLAIGFPVALILSWAFDVTPHGIRATRGTERADGSPQPAATMFTYLSHGLVLLAVGFLVIDQYLDLGTAGSSREAPTDVIRYHYGLAEPERLLSSYGLSIAVSPDGSRIAYVGPAEGGTQLWIRERERLRSTPVPHSEGARQPFFSPDGRGVGFVSDDRELKVIPTIGDPPLTLVDGGLNPFGGTWTEDGHVCYSTSDGLMRQKASGGGEPEAVAAASSAGPEVLGYAWPVHRRGMEDGQRDIYAMAADADAEPRPLVVSDFDEVAPALSPDRRWLAYAKSPRALLPKRSGRHGGRAGAGRTGVQNGSGRGSVRLDSLLGGLLSRDIRCDGRR
ncbi:MAG: hypothetical protein WD795_13440 [Woeseia sp.]